ncbi:hypothetical protein ACFPN2_12500 [Steroidobacter flavus]|uniref:Uncharacterized protein n=1 Tax=Steroidobacter flavus TaxID=1842136 RepID=A0ABV8SSF0_9GAMM
MVRFDVTGDDLAARFDARLPSGSYGLLLGIVLCIPLTVAVLSAIEAQSPLGQAPPTVILTINGQSQQSVYGDYSWRGVIADAFQFVAPRSPLLAAAHFSATLNLHTRLGPPSEASCALRRVTPDRCAVGDGPSFSCWRPVHDWNTKIDCPALDGSSPAELDFQVPPGRYVLSVKTWWNNVGGTTQEFSIFVSSNETMEPTR